MRAVVCAARCGGGSGSGARSFVRRAFGTTPDDFVEAWQAKTPFRRTDIMGVAYDAGSNANRASMPERVVSPMWTEKGVAFGRGSRKTTVANCWLREGEGVVTVNGRPLVDYFPRRSWREDVIAPFIVTETIGMYDVDARVEGGGNTGHAHALRMAIARALQSIDPTHRDILKPEGFLRRDPRKVERKKPGRAKARKRYQWVKR